MPRFEHFDRIAPLYDRLIGLPANHPLFDIANLPVSGRVLDAGGGTGRIAQQLVGLAGQVVVADSSLLMLRQAQLKEGLDTVGSKTERLPFPNECFECIVVVDAYHHLENQTGSLAEFWRVLALGGSLVIEEPDIRRFVVKMIALAEKLTLFRSHFVLAERIASSLRDLGAKTSVLRQGFNVWVIGEKADIEKSSEGR